MRSQLLHPIALLGIGVLVGCSGDGQETQTARPRTTGAAPTAQATPPASGGYTIAAVSDGGSVTGTVGFEGTPPPPTTLEITKDVSVCGEEKTFQIVSISDDGGLADAVVWIDGITNGKDWDTSEGAVDQRECRYHPHVQVVKAGSEIAITNNDNILHNIHAYHNETETLFNFAHPMKEQTTPRTLEKTGPVHLKCDVHSWMSSWVFVASHPYYTVTAADGSFTLDDVPPGSYTVKAWHEEFGEKTFDVTVAAGQVAEAGFSMP